ncbi:MAG: tRNA (adenosine(37)-N6)-dimethylallyltransferase MiaA, partial [Clostridia bacterium]
MQDEKSNIKPIYILGATASGKSAFAFSLAKKINGAIISADSMQIYKGLNIGTAKDDDLRKGEIEYYMQDIIDANESFSVAEYATCAKKHIADIIKRGKQPIIVGGTGLYIEALLYPMSFATTSKNEELRAKLNEELQQFGAEYMHNKLKALDFETALRLHANDTKRVIRAIEIVETTGKTLKENSDKKEKPDVIAVALNQDRAKLYQKINERVDKMFEDGLVDEVFSVGNFNYQSMQAIGYKEFAHCNFTNVDEKININATELDINEPKLNINAAKYDTNTTKLDINVTKYGISETELDIIKEKIKQDTRNYAK